jgi:ABC-type transport system involved in multi-copper enzyme maturation permease subunit
VKIEAIALTTFREAVRDKILYTLLFFALAMIAASAVVADLTIGEYGKIVRDLGLAAIDLFGLLIAIFVGIGLVYKEIERKTIYTIASKPIARWQFLIGKYLGLVMTLGAEVLVMAVGFLLQLYLTDAGLSGALLPAIWLIFVELLVVTAIAIVFSSFTTPMLAALFTIGITIIGRLSATLKELGEASGEAPGLRTAASLFYRLLPDLATFDIRTEAAYGRPVDWEYVGYATGYGLLWTVALLAVGTIVFQYRDFK